MTAEKNGLFDEVLKKLKRHDSWVILCHENPDGDTLGSAFALYSLGKREGKSVMIVCPDSLSDTFSFFPHAAELRVTKSLPAGEVRNALLAAVDISTEKRTLANMPELLSACADSVNIDHHGDNTMFAATNLVVPSASATAEIITALLSAYGKGITEGEASALYTALVTDNGNFRYNSTSVESHGCAQLLLEAGAKPTEIDDRINENMTDKILRLWGLALSRTELFAGGKCALFWLRGFEIDGADADSNALDGLINMLMRIKGVKVALFLAEKNGNNKLSVRSRAPYSARDLASRFGGGGHQNAAGAKISGGFEDTLASVKKEAEKYVAFGNTSAQ